MDSLEHFEAKCVFRVESCREVAGINWRGESPLRFLLERKRVDLLDEGHERVLDTVLVELNPDFIGIV